MEGEGLSICWVWWKGGINGNKYSNCAVLTDHLALYPTAGFQFMVYRASRSQSRSRLTSHPLSAINANADGSGLRRSRAAQTSTTSSWRALPINTTLERKVSLIPAMSRALSPPCNMRSWLPWRAGQAPSLSQATRQPGTCLILSVLCIGSRTPRGLT